MALTLDGMKVYGACVDRMDPASSYVEPENLARMEVHKGPSDLQTGSQTGGSVDLVSEDPVFGAPSARLDVGAEAPTGLRRVGVVAGASHGPLAVRVSGVYRQAAAYVPGGGRAALAFSGYTKRNGRIAATLRLGPAWSVTGQALADDAWNVGYPVLLMDATLAQARIGSLRLRREGAVRLDATIYANRVDHWMDDRTRDVLERPVMRGMYMPMAGYTQTTGAVAEAAADVGAWRWGATLDVHRVRQFGDMWMYSVYPGIADMYLLNVGHARAVNAAASASLGRRIGRFDADLQLRLDGTRRDVGDASARALLRGRDATLDTTARRLAVPSASLRLGYAAAPGLHLHLAASDAGRLPTLVEHYGHYVYNYADGYFYTGSPALGAERTRGLDVGADVTRGRVVLRLAAFGSWYRHHIGGVADPTVASTQSYRFRVYTDAGRAALLGGEASVLSDLGRGLTLAGQAAYVRARYPAGHVHGSGAHFAGLPPLHGRLALTLDRRRGVASLETRWATAQTDVPDGSDEQPTDGFAVVNASAGLRVGAHVELRATLENVFDAYYREHQSVGRLPGRGRTLYAGLSVQL